VSSDTAMIVSHDFQNDRQLLNLIKSERVTVTL
jgi:hypothetical protein